METTFGVQKADNPAQISAISVESVVSGEMRRKQERDDTVFAVLESINCMTTIERYQTDIRVILKRVDMLKEKASENTERVNNESAISQICSNLMLVDAVILGMILIVNLIMDGTVLSTPSIRWFTLGLIIAAVIGGALLFASLHNLKYYAREYQRIFNKLRDASDAIDNAYKLLGELPSDPVFIKAFFDSPIGNFYRTQGGVETDKLLDWLNHAIMLEDEHYNESLEKLIERYMTEKSHLKG